MSFAQQYPNTFVGQVTNQVTKRHDDEFKFLYNLLTALFAANGHSHSGDGSDGAPVLVNTVVTTPGDILYATAASTLARLGITADCHLVGNAAGTAPEWVVPYKVGSFTRNLTTASGNVGYTGVGFKPSAVIFFTLLSTLSLCVGLDNGTNVVCLMPYSGGSLYGSQTESIYATPGAGSGQTAKITTLDSDGFTLAWTKIASPTGTADITYLALR